MDPIEQLKADVLSGRIDANRLVDLIATVQRELQAAKQRIAELEHRNAELEQELAATSGTAKLGCVLRFAKAIQPLGGPKWPFFAAFQRHAGDQAAVPTAKRTRPYAFARRTVLLLLSHRRV